RLLPLRRQGVPLVAELLQQLLLAGIEARPRHRRGWGCSRGRGRRRRLPHAGLRKGRPCRDQQQRKPQRATLTHHLTSPWAPPPSDPSPAYPARAPSHPVVPVPWPSLRLCRYPSVTDSRSSSDRPATYSRPPPSPPYPGIRETPRPDRPASPVDPRKPNPTPALRRPVPARSARKPG